MLPDSFPLFIICMKIQTSFLKHNLIITQLPFKLQVTDNCITNNNTLSHCIICTCCISPLGYYSNFLPYLQMQQPSLCSSASPVIPSLKPLLDISGLSSFSTYLEMVGTQRRTSGPPQKGLCSLFQPPSLNHFYVLLIPVIPYQSVFF